MVMLVTLQVLSHQVLVVEKSYKITRRN